MCINVSGVQFFTAILTFQSNIEHLVLEELLLPIEELYKDVKRKALMRLEYEGLHRAEAIIAPGTRFHNDPALYAMDRYAYYVCYKCNKAYYGGEARCDAEIGENYDPTELVCGACSDVARAQMCPKHGTDFLEYKCRYCCSVAVFFCFGTTHFCNPCHDDFQRVTNLPKNELPGCPAGKQMVLIGLLWIVKWAFFCCRTKSKAIGRRRVSASCKTSTNWGGVCIRLWCVQKCSHVLIYYVYCKYSNI